MQNFAKILIVVMLVCTSMPASHAQQRGWAAQLAQNSTDMQMLAKKGATIGPMTPKLNKYKAAGRGSSEYSCDAVACWCSGGSDCLNLIDAKGGQCKHFVCGNDHGTPVCWCDL